MPTKFALFFLERVCMRSIFWWRKRFWNPNVQLFCTKMKKKNAHILHLCIHSATIKHLHYKKTFGNWKKKRKTKSNQRSLVRLEEVLFFGFVVSLVAPRIETTELNHRKKKGQPELSNVFLFFCFVFHSSVFSFFFYGIQSTDWNIPTRWSSSDLRQTLRSFFFFDFDFFFLRGP